MDRQCQFLHCVGSGCGSRVTEGSFSGFRFVIQDHSVFGQFLERCVRSLTEGYSTVDIRT
jgi:hypothetical protein